MVNKAKRIEWVDYLKSFTCFLVVLGHLLQSLQKSNIDRSLEITNSINWYIYLFHVPLFICISGYLYQKTKKEFTWSSYKNFVCKKVINLMVPYFVFYIIFISLKLLFSKYVNTEMGISEIINILNRPISPFWFLYALMSLFIITPILEKLLKNKKYIIMMVFISLKLISLFVKTNLFFLDSIMNYGIYFYLGKFINDNVDINKNKNIIASIIFFITAMFYYNIIEFVPDHLKYIISIILAIGGIYIAINIFKDVKKCNILDTFKDYTFQIYLMHTIFAAGVRILLCKLGITNYSIHFVLGLIASIYLPIIISIICEKIKWLNFFIYPIDTVKKIKLNNDKELKTRIEQEE